MNTSLRAATKEKDYAGTTDSTSIIWTPQLGGGTRRTFKPWGIVWWSCLNLWIAMTSFWRLCKQILRVTHLGEVFMVFNAAEWRSIFGLLHAGAIAYYWSSWSKYTTDVPSVTADVVCLPWEGHLSFVLLFFNF